MPRKPKYEVHLTDEERQTLEQFVARGKKNARELTRARVLLLADAGKPDREITAVLDVSRPTVSAVRQKAAHRAEAPIVAVLADAPRAGRPITVDSRVEAHIALLACSAPPEGAARWTLHLIADKLVQLEVIESISHERVRTALKKTD